VGNFCLRTAGLDTSNGHTKGAAVDYTLLKKLGLFSAASKLI
jgi:hypothetical protein